ncbi:MAG: thiamine phosphate synthase [Aquificae bacterium]|nr:thiamine phosphate synthase [Aquificota bacterium]
MKKIDYSLYVITDENLIKKDIGKAVEKAIKGGATVIQYRAKNKDSRTMYKEASEIKKVCDKYGIPFIVNDRVDIALAVNADGVHVGQEDLDVEVVRRLIGFDKIVGLSTKNLKQVKKANSLPVDYIGFGSVFPTNTKEDAKLAGIENLKKALEISLIPVVAIGGINHENIDQLIEIGCENIAVVSAVFKEKNIEENTKKLKNKLKNQKRMGFTI